MEIFLKKPISTTEEINKAQSNIASSNIKKSDLPKQPSAFSSWITGVGIAVLPPLLFVLLIRRTIDVARDPFTGWWLELCLLLGTSFLLFSKKGGEKNRKTVEVTIFVAALAVFITKLILTGIPQQS